jgi:hypothetical protein
VALAAGRLLGWMQARLGGRVKDALDDLVAKPGSDDNRADLRKQLAKALEADPALAAELRVISCRPPPRAMTACPGMSAARAPRRHR